MASGPWYSSVTGGIVNQASSVSSATTPSMSLPEKAAANRAATSRSRAEWGSGARSRSGLGSRAAIVARARCRGGRCWTAVTKASAIASLDSYRASPVNGLGIA